MVLNAGVAAGMAMVTGVTAVAGAAYKGNNNSGAIGGSSSSSGNSWESRSRSGSNTSTSSVTAWGKKHQDTAFQQKFWQ